MANCVIYPVPLLQTTLDKSGMTYRANFGIPQKIIVYVWYIEGARQRILVDAGASYDYMVNVRKQASRQIQTLDHGLKQFGLKPEDIDLVIVTHLHHDHIAEASRFTGAKFIVQKKELDFARNPHPATGDAYARSFFEKVEFETVNGDTRISDEITLLSTPGHSPGGQSIQVQTTAGKVIISGQCTIRDNFAPPPPVTLPVMTPGIHVDALQAYDSCLRIKELADIVIPLHDPSMAHKTIP